MARPRFFPRLLSLLLFAAVSLSAAAQLQSPEQFLGYPIGSRYTPHHRLVAYYEHVAAAVPASVRLQPYGQTYEGRPLMVAFISSPANITNLEAIRTNNLRLTGSGEGGAGRAEGAPAIVWLSYNVHGNETSSSEAGLMTLYELVRPGGRAASWLQNTVVVMDPCLNPDGRDRYVNWFRSVSGATPNPALEAREHREPWPGGRTNHYNFDLNRDWAWQTQVETQQRLKVYRQWMPQVHVDFHEQGINSPYYFAPAAQPYHEVITPFQRDFQNTIGRNHARYFDQQGWLYFTREVFDLLYPAYGDTYPTFNGAIGMTYEQAGGPAGGSAVQTEDGDTLTLLDRATHHFTTSLSTIEVASGNAPRLLQEFDRYFRESRTQGIGNYKSYIIRRTPADAGRVEGLLELLRKNDIRYLSARPGNVRGYNYANGKQEAFAVREGDILIPAAQPQGTLVKVLFEPQATLVDSNTYDITAWSLPYVFGVPAWATAQRLEGGAPLATPAPVRNAPAEPYGYAVAWDGLRSVRLAGALLQEGVKLRVSDAAFKTGNRSFERGALLILRTGNRYTPDFWNRVRTLADREGVALQPLTTGFVDTGYDFGSSRVRMLRKKRIALITGEGTDANAAGEVWHFFEQDLKYPITLINQNDVGRMRWSDYDVVILPNGNFRFLQDKAQADALRNWISGGGDLIAMEGAVAGLARLDWTIRAKKEEGDSAGGYDALRRYEDRDREYLHRFTPGSIYRVELDNSHPLAFGFPDYYYTLKQDQNIYEFIGEGGWNVGVLKRNAPVAGFVGRTLQQRLQDGTLFGVQEVGSGTITYLADNVLFRSFWQNGKLLFSNAVFLVGQ